MIRLTREQTEAAMQHSEGVECEGDGTQKTFILMDADVVRRLRGEAYEKDVHRSIAEGIADMQRGRMMTVEEARRICRESSSPAN